MMTKATTDMETPTGAPQAQLDQEDALTKGLLNVAYSVVPDEPVKKKVSRFGRRESRFWFQLESEKDKIARRRQEFKPPTLEHIDDAVTTRLKTFQKEVPDLLRSGIQEVREFFLKELAPLTLAAPGGVIQARDVAERMFNTTIDTGIFSRFDNMVNCATTIKVALFVLDYFDLPEDFLPMLLGPRMQQPDSDTQKLLQLMKTMADGQEKLASTMKKGQASLASALKRGQDGKRV